MMLVVVAYQTAAATAPVPSLLAWQRALAGMSAYCAATLISSPVDVVKCRVQLKQEPGSEQKQELVPLVTEMVRKDGPLVFFSGLGPAMLMSPAAIVQYTLIDPLRDVMPLFAAALIAGTLDVVIKCPFERLKTIVQSGEKESPTSILKQTYASHGIRGLWAGLGATLLRDVPYLVLKWLSYVQCQSLFASLDVTSQMANLLAGAVAGAIAAIAVTPADVVKTRCQVSEGSSVSPRSVCTDLLHEGGVPALFRGLGPRLMRIPLYTSITLATFDFVKASFASQIGLN